MNIKRMVLSAVIGVLFCLVAASVAQAQPPAAKPAKLYNTAKQKLLEGKQIVGGTVFDPDPNLYCAMANAGYDFLWIDLQHSPLTYEVAARMIYACHGAPA